MTHSLVINSNESYRVDSGTTETHANTQVDGTLQVNGTLVLTGEEPDEVGLMDDVTFPDGIGFEGYSVPNEIDFGEYSFPGQLVLSSMNMGIAVFLVGIMAITLGASWILKNYAAGVTWSVSLLVLIFVGVFGLGLELFWVAMVTTVLLLVAGMIVRWSHG